MEAPSSQFTAYCSASIWPILLLNNTEHCAFSVQELNFLCCLRWTQSWVKFNSHQAHFRSFLRWVFHGSNDRTNSVKTLKEDIVSRIKSFTAIPPGPPHHVTMCVYEKITTKYTNINTNKSMHSEMGPVTQKPNPENCKNCSSKCAYDCAQLQYTIQHKTVLIISSFTFRQSS